MHGQSHIKFGVYTYCASVGLLRKILLSVHGYGQDKVNYHYHNHHYDINGH
jgi:hypothetical protein